MGAEEKVRRGVGGRFVTVGWRSPIGCVAGRLDSTPLLPHDKFI